MANRDDATAEALLMPTGTLHPVVRPRSLVTIVKDQIGELIVTGGLRLGEQLSENSLADRLGVSRTPVREALLRLAAEGLVEVAPQRGTFVFRCDADQVRDICQLREILEAGALALAVRRDRAGLLEALDASLEAAMSADPATGPDYQPFDQEFHELLVAASGNAELIGAYHKIAGRIRAIRHRIIRTRDQVQESQMAHRRVIDHVRLGQDDLADQELRHHVYSSYRGAQALADSLAG